MSSSVFPKHHASDDAERPEYRAFVAEETPEPRLATSDDAGEIAALLHDFNTEFEAPSPGPNILEPRLRMLLAEDRTFAVIAGRPSVGVGLVTLRPNVWYEGLVGLLDELYVVPELRGDGIGTALLRLIEAVARDRDVDAIEINVDEGDSDAQRFYERHGYTTIDPDSNERALYYRREID